MTVLPGSVRNTMGTFGPDDGMPHSTIISGTFGLKNN
jgi:hypothetical protein